MSTVPVNIELLKWALERSGREIEKIEGKNKDLDLSAWLNGDKQPTLKQLETFAKRTYTSIPLLLLRTPIEEPMPISDFRLLPDNQHKKPTRNLLDTIYDCQLRQEWYREYCINDGLDKLDIVASLTANESYRDAAKKLVEHFSIPKGKNDFTEYVELIENEGVLVMSTGVVKGNTQRPLSLEDARGFALHDEYAPVIFVNAKEKSHSAKKFTLMHELAHIALGITGLSNNYHGQSTKNQVETWCNKVATEILVPEQDFKNAYQPNASAPFADKDELAKHFGVSTLVIIRRIKELGYYKRTDNEFWQYYNDEQDRIRYHIENNESSGGNYYNSVPTRNSKRFYAALKTHTLGNKTLFREAMQLLNISSSQTLVNLMEQKQ